MALFTEAFVEEMTGRVDAWQQTVGTALGRAPADAPPPDTGPLQEQLRLLMRVANGELTRATASQQMVQAVEAALQGVLDLLLGTPLYTRAPLPAGFWQSDLGVLISRARWWLSADELITISNAAALAFGENTQANRMKIARAIDNGLLEWVPDPSVANPQQNRRVLRPQVERLGQQRRPPE